MSEPLIKTLANSRKIIHPNGSSFLTPKLVPSFSSKGFGLRYDDETKRWRSDVHDIFQVASEILSESMLVSAFDISHHLLPAHISNTTELTIVDSGGYEVAPGEDLSAIAEGVAEKPDWDVDRLQGVLNMWPAEAAAIFVSYDHPEERCSLTVQLERARKLLAPFRSSQLRTVLIKPENLSDDYIRVDALRPVLSELNQFDVIGITEKELGDSLLDRMTVVSDIRLLLDENNIKVPIHIFGSLDPISSVLYFVSGAEIFDGLTWLRYGYYEGKAVYYHNMGAWKYGIKTKKDKVKSRMIMDNYNYLMDLQEEMVKFSRNGDFNTFSFNSDLIRQSFESLRARNRRI